MSQRVRYWIITTVQYVTLLHYIPLVRRTVVGERWHLRRATVGVSSSVVLCASNSTSLPASASAHDICLHSRRHHSSSYSHTVISWRRPHISRYTRSQLLWQFDKSKIIRRVSCDEHSIILEKLTSIEDRGQTLTALLRYHANTRWTLTFDLDLW